MLILVFCIFSWSFASVRCKTLNFSDSRYTNGLANITSPVPIIAGERRHHPAGPVRHKNSWHYTQRFLDPVAGCRTRAYSSMLPHECSHCDCLIWRHWVDSHSLVTVSGAALTLWVQFIRLSSDRLNPIIQLTFGLVQSWLAWLKNVASGIITWMNCSSHNRQYDVYSILDTIIIHLFDS